MSTCPTCGQAIKGKSDANALLELLTNGLPHREVYRGADSSGWFVTYGGGQWADSAVRELIRGGKIQSVYSNCPDDAYHVGKTLDYDTTTRERKSRRSKTFRAYTDGTVNQ